jgi:hypothetical protein
MEQNGAYHTSSTREDPAAKGGGVDQCLFEFITANLSGNVSQKTGAQRCKKTEQKYALKCEPKYAQNCEQNCEQNRTVRSKPRQATHTPKGRWQVGVAPVSITPA